MSEIIIFHNPRCSKSREALALLQERGLTPQVREYLRDVPSVEELQRLHQMLGCAAHVMLRPKEEEYNTAGLSPRSSEAEVFAAIHAYPKLLERPIVVNGNKAVIARPLEKLLEIFV